jgi:3',5'-cyclic AMP phosphodiesterase CpdA
MLIAQISDLHVRRAGELSCGVVDTNALLERCVAKINSLDPRPDVVLATGDLVDSWEAEAEYRMLRRFLQKLAMPFFLIPGNHDGRRTLRTVFHDHEHLRQNEKFIQYAIADYPVRMIFLDTLDEGNDAGLMDAPRLAWLEDQLDRARSRPTIVVMHHPPFATGIQCMDKIGCRGAEPLARIIRRHANVERVLCGHLHRAVQTRWAGTLACSAPSTAHQIVLDLNDEDRSPGSFALEPPAFLLHRFRPATGFVTHLCYTDAYPGPYRFAS